MIGSPAARVAMCLLIAAASAAAQERSAPGTAPGAGPAAAAADTAPPAASKAARPPESLEEIVVRVQRRLAEERIARPAPPARQSSRVTLVWRPSIVWPSELTRPVPQAAADRAIVTWRSLEPAPPAEP